MAPAPLTRQHGIPCRFYSLGYCKKGDACAYDHSTTVTSPTKRENPALVGQSVITPSSQADSQRVSKPEPTLATTRHESDSRGLEFRNLRGAAVVFGPGAVINSLEFSSDYSAVQISCLQPEYNTEKIQEALAMLGELIPLSSIRMKTGLDDLPIIAHINVKDPEFGQRLKLKVAEQVEKHRIPGLDISVMKVGT